MDKIPVTNGAYHYKSLIIFSTPDALITFQKML